MQICKENVFSMGGEGTTLPESQNFLDKFGKNLVILYKFSRFVSEKINYFYPKKKYTKVSHFLGGGWWPLDFIVNQSPF